MTTVPHITICGSLAVMELLRIPDAALATGVPCNTLYRWARAGTITVTPGIEPKRNGAVGTIMATVKMVDPDEIRALDSARRKITRKG